VGRLGPRLGPARGARAGRHHQRGRELHDVKPGPRLPRHLRVVVDHQRQPRPLRPPGPGPRPRRSPGAEHGRLGHGSRRSRRGDPGERIRSFFLPNLIKAALTAWKTSPQAHREVPLLDTDAAV
jgi:hypothetical protein